MGHMEVGLMVGIGQKTMPKSDMAGSWILHIGEMMDIRSILIIVLIETIIVIVIILIGGVMGDIF